MALTIHVGAHKTASTHLQQTLRALTVPMQGAGIHYQDITHLRRGWARLDGSLGAGPEMARRRSRLRRQFDAAAEFWPQMLLSEENILGGLGRLGLMGDEGLYPNAAWRVDRLCGVLRRRPAVLCLAVRAPLAFLRSAFAMRVEGGFELDFNEYLGGFDPAGPLWSGLAQRLVEVPGVAGLVVWRYEEYRAVLPRLLEEMLPRSVAAQAPDLRPAVVGLSQAAFAEIRRQIDANPDADRVAVARAAKTMFPRGRGAGPVQVADAALAARAAAAHADDMAALARIGGVRLLGTPPAGAFGG